MNELNIIVGMCGVLIGLAFNYKNYRTTQDNGVKTDAQEGAELKTKLDYISKGVDDIRLDIKSTNREVDELKTRVTRVEESVKSSHHRIDEIIKDGE